MLRRRPDIRIAERRLAGATARVGVAVGDLFPKVTLTGSFGYLAPTFGDLGQAEAKSSRSAPGITWAAFDLGRVRARISSARAETDAALSTYEGAVLNALEDTEGALVSYGRSQSHRSELAAAATSSDKAADLARKRFEGGLVDFLEVLDAERTALTAELLHSQSRTDEATSLIAVYKALVRDGICRNLSEVGRAARAVSTGFRTGSTNPPAPINQDVPRTCHGSAQGCTSNSLGGHACGAMFIVSATLRGAVDATLVDAASASLLVAVFVTPRAAAEAVISLLPGVPPYSVMNLGVLDMQRNY